MVKGLFYIALMAVIGCTSEPEDVFTNVTDPLDTGADDDDSGIGDDTGADDDDTGIDEGPVPGTWSSIECTMLHTTMADWEILWEFDFYEVASPTHDLEIGIAFNFEYWSYHPMVMDAYAVTDPSGFTVDSQEVTDGTVDHNGWPFNETHFIMTWSEERSVPDENLSRFFDEDGQMDLSEGDSAWWIMYTEAEDDDAYGPGPYFLTWKWSEYAQEDYFGTCTINGLVR